MKSTGRVLLLTFAFFGIVGLILWTAFVYQIEPSAPQGYKKLSGTLAEGFVYRDTREKHPRVSCAACRIGKKKMGPISLGAFNTLELDDLVVNLPESLEEIRSSEPQTQGVQRPSAELDSKALVKTLNLESVFAMMPHRNKRFAGIKITNLVLNKMQGDEVLPVLAAQVLATSGKRLVLRTVTLYRPEGVLTLPEADFEIKPTVRVVWREGMWNLPIP